MNTKRLEEAVSKIKNAGATYILDKYVLQVKRSSVPDIVNMVRRKMSEIIARNLIEKEILYMKRTDDPAYNTATFNADVYVMSKKDYEELVSSIKELKNETT